MSLDKLLLTGARQSLEKTASVRGRKPLLRELPAAVGKLRKEMRKAGSSNFVSYAEENGRPAWLWVSGGAHDNLDGKIVEIKTLCFDTRLVPPGVLSGIVKKARRFHGVARLRGALPASESGKIPFFLKEGFRVHSHVLYGRVADSLRALEAGSDRLPPDYEVRRVDPKKDLSALARLESVTARSDSSCFVSGASAAALRNSLRKTIRDSRMKAFFGLFHCGRMTGMMRVWRPKPGEGLIGNVGVEPAHRGKGLSSHLYLAGLRWMREQGIASYVGRSSTDRVLSRMGAMKRRVIYTYLEVK